MIATVINYLLLTIFGILAFAMLFGVLLALLVFNGEQSEVLRLVSTAAVMWCAIGGWWFYTGRFRNDEVSGALLPCFWVAAACIAYAGVYMVSYA